MSKAKCSDCRFREARPEVGMGSGLIYCSKKKIVLSPKSECILYRKSSAVPRSVSRKSRRFERDPNEFD